MGSTEVSNTVSFNSSASSSTSSNSRRSSSTRDQSNKRARNTLVGSYAIRSGANTTNSTTPVVEQIQMEHKIQIQNEECLLRTKAYHYTSSNIVEKAFDRTIDTYTNDRLCTPLRKFMNQFQPLKDCEEEGEDYIVVGSQSNQNNFEDEKDGGSQNDDIHTRKNRKYTQVRADELRECIRQQIERENIKYDPALLPIAVLNVPPSIMDRKVILKALQSQLKFTPSREHQDAKYVGNSYNPAVCILSEKRSQRRNRVDSYLISILSQVS